ncbi:MAG: FAD-binding protein, partial [Rhodocyclaceae bacterium]|nr:FAD-binding protein [Rhodocyclaceae bacterium]
RGGGQTGAPLMEIRFDEPMAAHVSWRAGGPVARACFPRDLDDLAAFMARLRHDEPLLVVGLGSNLLIRDGGFDGTAIFTHGALNQLRIEADGAIYAEAGVATPKLARFAANHNLAQAEFLAGIPGTLGGALAMNAGCYGDEIWHHVERVAMLNRQGELIERSPRDFSIGYRHVGLKQACDEIFVAAWLRFPPGDAASARARIRALLERRIASQPLALPNAGSVFRNPPGDHAARLIEAARRKMVIAPILRGEIKGRAAIERHARSHGTTAATLYRWVKLYKHGGDAALADKDRADKGQARGIVSAEWEAAMRSALVPEDKMLEVAAELTRVIRGLWAQAGKPSWKQVAMLAETRLISMTAELLGADERTAKRFCKLSRRFVEGERRFSLVAVKDRDAKGFYDKTPAIQRTRAALKPGDCVFGDVSPADIPVLRPDGEIAWARLIAWMDAATNMLHITGHLPGKGAGVRREHVALSFTAVCQSAPFGMPKRLYLDNGSEYSWAQMLDAWRELTRLTQGVFGGVWDAPAAGEHFGIVTRSLPFKPRAKLIEGAFGNLLRFMGWHPAFSGSDRMRKKVATLGKGVQPIPVEDLKGFLAQAVAAYNATPQEGHLAGKSPAERMAEFLADGFEPYQAPAEVLGFAFGETHEVRCRMGQVRVGGWTYYDKALIALDDEKVTVRWPRHAPDAAYVFHRNRFVAAATPMPVFAWGDPEGAKHAARLASEAREVVEVMRGQVAWLDPRDLMGEFARLGGVAQVVEEAGRRAAKIALTPEAQAAAEARRAKLEEALALASPRNPDLVANRHGVVDEEAEAFRAWLEDDEPKQGAA